MRILVFAGKDVGLKCVEFLIENHGDDDFTFVVCAPEQEAIVELIERSKKSYFLYSAEAVATVFNFGTRHYDWLLNLWGAHIFRPRELEMAKKSLNIHPSYLPYGRGRDSVVWAIRLGHPAGVTLHAISENIDEGPIWYQERIPYDLPCRGGDLYQKVIERAISSFCEQWPVQRNTKEKPRPQAPESETFRRRDLWIDQVIDIDRDEAARDVTLKLLAHDFSPNYSALLKIDGKTYRAALSLKIEE